MKKDGKWFLKFFLPKLPLFILFLPVVILIRCLRPLIWIRFFPISDRIGHAAGDVDMYVVEKKMGLYHSKAIDIFCASHLTKVNQQIVKLWSRVLPVSTLAHWVSWVNMEIPGWEAHYCFGRFDQSRDIYLLTYKTPPQVSFTPSENERGEALLRSMGVPKGASIVCFHGRDSLYLADLVPGKDWSCHDFRDFSIGNYALAAQELVSRGYYVIRMGKIVKEKFPLVHPQVIDYANSPFRSDFADIYIIAQCHFFVGQSGIESVARLFRKPVVYTNYIPVGYVHTWSDKFLTIIKLFRHRKESRFLNFKEIFIEELRNAVATKEYQDRDIEVLENSPEEIRDVVLEMEERLKEQWQSTEAQEGLQRQFWKLYPLDPRLHIVNKARMGTKFLEKYQDLLYQ